MLADKAVGRKYRGISNEERKAERRAKLLEAAADCFAQEGFHQTTVRGICGRAGLTERYFYESFANMEELFQSVYLQTAGAVRESILQAVQGVDPADLKHFSQAAMTAFFSCMKAYPQAAPILFHEALSVSRSTSQLALATLNAFVDLLVSLGRSSFEQRAAAGIEPTLVSAALVGGIMQMAVRWSADGFAAPVDTVVDHAMLVFAGVLEG